MKLEDFSFFRNKKEKNKVLEELHEIAVSNDMSRLYGFSCKHCGAGLFDGDHCLGCHASYPRRVLKVAKWHRKAKWKLIKVLEYDAAAARLKETTEKIARDVDVSPKETYSEMLDFWGA